jgi:hypothetical protein
MKTIIAIILSSLCILVPAIARQTYRTTEPDNVYVPQTVRFVALPIYIDSGSRALAAYQFELKAVVGQVKIVGVEGGRHPAFKEPPYYDPAALSKNRIIIAAFSTDDNLPTGRTQIATIHLEIIGDTRPQYKLALTVAADSKGKEIPAELTFEQGE